MHVQNLNSQDSCEQSVLGMGGVLEDGGSSLVDSAVEDALQKGQWSLPYLLGPLNKIKYKIT